MSKINLVNNGIFPITKDKNGNNLLEKLDTEYSVSGTFQGEGALIGVPVLFIRTSGCNLRCWVDKKGRTIPYVYLENGKKVKLKDVKVGSKVYALDEKTKELTLTEVTDVMENTTTEWYEIQVEKMGTLILTPEHPLLTTNGWKKACELTNSDELIHIPGSERNSFRMKHHNPMFNLEPKNKVYKHENYLATRVSSGKRSAEVKLEKGINWKTYLTKEEIQELRDKSSSRMKSNNPMFSLEVRQKNFKTRSEKGYSKSKLETWFEGKLEEWGVLDSVRYTGTGGFVVVNKNKNKTRLPDFKVKGEKKVIEIGIEYFRRPDFKKYTEETEEFYKEAGFNVLVLDGNLSEEELKVKTLSFLRNGLKVKKIKHFKNLAFYKNSKLETREYKTHNLHCFPHHNYLVQTASTQAIVSHNCVFKDNKGGATPCDTAYSSHYAETNLTEIEDIISVVNHNKGNISHIVVSGGEPTLQKEALAELLQRLQQEGFHTTIETNATIYTDDIAKYTNLVSMSPKLKTSNPTKEAVELANKIDPKLKYNEKWEKKHDEIRRDIPTIQKYIDSCYYGDATSTHFEINYNRKKAHKDFQLKFVVSRVEDLDEIENDFIKHLQGVKPTNIYLMPEGITPEELMERGGWVAEEAIKRGWVFAPRLHCLMFGHAKRGV